MAQKTVVLATWGSHGDVHPFIAVALALKARGIRSVIATNTEYKRSIQDEGVAFHAMEPSSERLRRDTGLVKADFLQAITKRPVWYMIEKAILPYVPETCKDLMALTSGADLVVAGSLSFGALMAAERLGKPTIGVVLAPISLLSPEDPPLLMEAPRLSALMRRLGPAGAKFFYGLGRLRLGWMQRRIDAARAAVGLGPAQGNWIMEAPYSADEVVALYSPLLGGAPARPAKPTMLAGFAVFDRDGPGQEKLTPEIERFLSEGEPPLIFTLGSAFVLNGKQFYETSTEAARSLGRRALLLVGRDAEAELAAALGSTDILVAGYAPHSLIFSRAAACIHHGGIGTTAQALRAAAPQLVCPIFADQADNAMKVERLGVARVLPYRKVTLGRLARQLGELLADPEAPLKARQTADLLAAEDGAEALADRIVARLEREVAA